MKKYRFTVVLGGRYAASGSLWVRGCAVFSGSLFLGRCYANRLPETKLSGKLVSCP
ncbi:hypothetical protein EIKCOROL_02600 [Eikenella corrodens ATCC 23834]|uniref:Uncharacterized protein n=1 Tax=Eikenella corrodens ATCC 23834 TaxID=546274 RepID=C0DYY4_EIKCO|nr:hypothetical protein EIKCOROL_02600 [Eikenella corrodens ATCC 23834]